jgi:hypothetical protein
LTNVALFGVADKGASPCTRAIEASRGLRSNPIIVEGGGALRLGAVIDERALSDILGLRGVDRAEPRRASYRRWRNEIGDLEIGQADAA